MDRKLWHESRQNLVLAYNKAVDQSARMFGESGKLYAQNEFVLIHVSQAINGVDEILLANWPCAACQSMGWIIVDGEHVDCAECNGYGYDPV